MKHKWLFIFLVFASVLFAGCSEKTATAEKTPPYQLEEVAGSEFKRVVLTEKAAERLDVQTTPIRNDEGSTKVVPYASVLYGLEGETWVYTSPENLVFVRQPIVIDHIEGDLAFISDGPDTGTEVVTVGVAELYGAEVGVSK